MPNAKAHRIGAALTIGAVMLAHDFKNDEITARPLLGVVGGALFGTLPDILEPAYHPNHRQFFHSFAMLGIVGYGLYRLYRWKPKEKTSKVFRGITMVALGAYMVHLVMDSRTSKSLPVI